MAPSDVSPSFQDESALDVPSLSHSVNIDSLPSQQIPPLLLTSATKGPACCTHQQLSHAPPDKNYQSTAPSNGISSPPSTTKLFHSPDPQSQSSQILGFILLALSSLLFASGVTAMSYIEGRYNISSISLTFLVSSVEILGSTLGFIFFTPVLSIIRSLRRNHVILLSIRGISGCIALFCLTSALNYLPTGDADTIFFMAPFLTLLLSSMLLGEPVAGGEIVASVVAFVGAVLVSKPSAEDALVQISTMDRLTGSLYAITGAVSLSAVMISVRALVTSTHFLTSVWSLGFFGTLMSMCVGASTIRTDAALHTEGVALALSVGLLGFAGQLCFNCGMQFCKASTATLIRNLEVPMTYILALLFLHQVPSLERVAGSSLVVGSALCVGLRQVWCSASRER